MTLLSPFERIARAASLFTQEPLVATERDHPFETRNIHEKMPSKVKKLFDDAHYAQATFEAAKFLDKSISQFSGLNKSGSALMQEVFKEMSPLIALTPLSNDTEKTEQRGFMYIFTGAVWAIRNPRGHEFDVQDGMDQSLDHLAFFSMLMRGLEDAGKRF